MSLITDARICNNSANLAKDKIKIKVLPEVERDLDMSEKISLAFLMSSLECLDQSYDKITELLERNKDGMLLEWIETSPQKDWEEKLLEALFIIKNREVIKKLGFTNEEQDLFKKRYQIEEKRISPNLNRVIKTLYYLCEDLSDEKTASLMSKFQTHEFQRKELELFLLFLIKKKFICVSGENGQLNNLLSALRKIDYSKCNSIYIDIENFNNNQDANQQNVQDAQNSMGNSLLMVIENYQQRAPESETVSSKNEMYDFHKGLCIIINQIEFDSRKHQKGVPEYKSRHGSKPDVDRLKSTFEDFGFEVKIKQNLTAEQFSNLLNTIGNFTKNDYDCIILTIMSHGNEETFVTKECSDVRLEDVRNNMCTPNLKGVVKIVIIQACQGNLLGHLVTDAPSKVENPLNAQVILAGLAIKENQARDSDNIRFADFIMFKATIKKYRSIRNTHDGTWFIQTLCKVLQESDEITWADVARKVKHLVSQKRGTVGNTENVVQIPEIMNDTLRKTFLFRKKKRESVNESTA